MDNAMLIKYPRTRHLHGSRLQPGDEDLSQVPFSAIKGKRLVVEEKLDGANSAVSFGPDGELLLQSRGHYLMGGYRERHYNLFKQWARVHMDALFSILDTRYILYGEWMYAKHTVYYDRLPHYFFEFDIFDRETGRFLDTRTRQNMLRHSPVVSVPVLAEGEFQTSGQLTALLGRSNYIGPDHLARLRAACGRLGMDSGRVCRETDATELMEGLYIKVEADGQVIDRMKFVRPTFYQTVQLSQSHWQERPIVPNELAVPLQTLFLKEGE